MYNMVFNPSDETCEVDTPAAVTQANVAEQQHHPIIPKFQCPKNARPSWIAMLSRFGTSCPIKPKAPFLVGNNSCCFPSSSCPPSDHHSIKTLEFTVVEEFDKELNLCC